MVLVVAVTRLLDLQRVAFQGGYPNILWRSQVIVHSVITREV